MKPSWRPNGWMAGLWQPSAMGWVWRYALAVLAVALAMGLHLALEAKFGRGLPDYATFYPAVMVVAVVAGFRPALVATALAGGVVGCWLLPPHGQWIITAAPLDRIGLLIFFVMALTMSAFVELYRRKCDQLAAYEREAAVLDSQSRLAIFAKATFEGIIESQAGRILDCNEQFARMMGYPVAELRGMPIADLVAPEDLERVTANIRLKQESTTEHAMIRQDGTRIIIEAHGRPVSPGNTLRHTAVRDITAYKRAEETLRYQAELLDKVSDTIISTDETFHIKSWNKAAERNYGWQAAEARGQNAHDLFRAELLGISQQQLNEQLMSQGSAETDALHHDRHGRKRFVHAMITLLRNPQGQVTGTLAVFRDITERKQAEEALRDSVLRFRLALRNSPVSVAIQNRQLVYQWAYNQQTLRPDEIVGKTDADLFAPEHLAPIREAKLRVLESGTEENVRLWLTSKGGRYFLDCHFEPIRNPAGEITGIGITSVNLTEQKLAEEALRDNQERLDLALTSSRMATFDLDIASNHGTWSDGANALLGTQPETFSGSMTEFLQIIHPDDQTAVRTTLANAIKGQSNYEIEYRVAWPDGSIHHIGARGKVHRDATHQAVRITGVCWDITARKQAEESLRMANKAALNIMQDAVLARQQTEEASAALRESEAAERARRTELETLMDALPTAVFIAHDAACLRITGNRAAMTLLRSTPERNLSHSAVNHDLPLNHEYWSGERRLDAHELPMQRAAATGQAVHNAEMEVVFPDGAKRQIIGSALPLFDESGTVRGCIGAFMDLTKRKLGQRELRRMNRALRALNDSNRALRDAKTESGLLQEVCRIITEVCGHAMVWIGYADTDPAQSVRPVASAGGDYAHYLEQLRVSWADTERGRGPTGTAIRSGLPNQCNDIRTDSRLAPWRDDALRCGFASTLALPMLAEGKAFGSVTLYARQPAGFATNEVKLLGDLVSDLSLGITTLRLREAHLQAEAALRESEERFRSIFHNAATPMAVKHLDGQILEINQAYCEMLDFSQQELLTSTLDDLTFPEDRLDPSSETMRQLMAREITAFRNEKRFRHHNGHPVWCDTSVSLVCKPDGSAAYWIEQAHDITSRKAAEEALYHSEQFARSQWAEAETALESFPANIAILDDSGSIVRVNTSWTAFASFNGAHPDAVAIGTNYLTVCDSAHGTNAGLARDFAAGIRSVLSGQRDRFTLEYPCHSPDQQRWFIGYVTAARGDGTARAVVAHVDITVQKLIEEQIRNLNQQLETRVLERTNELQHAITALEAEILNRQRLEREILEISEREQSRLGQDLHDGLGQELSGIAMLGDVLAKQLQAQSHPLAKTAGQIANYVRATIDSTRRLAKGHYPIELNRYGLLIALKDLADQTSHRTGIRCELRQYGADPQLEKSAEIHLYRIVQECISNAVKHAKPSCITIESLAGDARHTFAVTDDGAGFDLAAVSSGMGLHLMDYRARIIGGEITVERPAQGGCRIICNLTI